MNSLLPRIRKYLQELTYAQSSLKGARLLREAVIEIARLKKEAKE